jgi:hypothetical protein
LAWSISAQYSSNINVENSVFIGSRAIGLNIIDSEYVTLNNLIVADVTQRPNIKGDKEGCVSICAYFGASENCRDVRITNSIAAGCRFAGFLAPGHDCDKSEDQDNFRNNVAHSIEGSGAHIFPNPRRSSHGSCYEGSHFAAYKNQQVGLGTNFGGQECIMTNMTMIDNVIGISIQTAGDGAKAHTYLRDSHIYGETEAEDCPKSHNCMCSDKLALLLFGSNGGGKPIHIEASHDMPHYGIGSSGAWAATSTIENVVFENFESRWTACGKETRIFKINKSASDYIPIHNFRFTTFKNVHHDVIAFLMDPPSGWNNPNDCVGFPCTAPSNVILDFFYTEYEG